jgi:hypothetical protein
MARAIALKDAPATSGTRRAEIGLEDYKKEFGHPITEGHWRRLFRRTLERAGTRWPLDATEIYLPERPARRETATAEPTQGHEDPFASIRARIETWADRANPTAAEMQLLWGDVCAWCEDQAQAGIPQKAARERLTGFLWAQVRRQFASREAVRKAVARKVEVWVKAQGDPDAFRDRRAEANAKRAIPPNEEEEQRIVWEALRRYRGRVAPAVRAVRGQAPGAPKSYVPASLRQRVTPLIQALQPIHQGPRAADKASPPMDLSYDGIHSMDCLSIDDVTLNSYFWADAPRGEIIVTRGQIILIIDFRSSRILHFGMIPEEQPNSLLAWQVTTRAIGQFGIPKVLQVERGRIFRDSKLMTGGRPVRGEWHAGGWEPVPVAEREMGLQRLGIRISTARRARSKAVEGVIGLLQNLMDGEPGYAGRFERLDRPERTATALRDSARTAAELASGRPHPSKFFLSMGEWQERVARIIEEYNRTPQEGKKLAGLSPDDAFRHYWPTADPPTRLGEDSRHLLAYHRKAVDVRGGAVAFDLRGERYSYRNEQLSRIEGRPVLVWLDPEDLQLVTVTDMKGRNAITIERDGKPNALQALTGGSDTLSVEQAKTNRHMAHLKAVHRTMAAKFEPTFRQNFVSREVAETGATIAAQRKEAASQVEKVRGQADRGRARLSRLGLAPEAVSASVDVDAASREFEAMIAAAKAAEAEEQTQKEGHGPQ